MASKGAERVELQLSGSDDVRVVDTHELDSGTKDRIDEVTVELLASAQDECDILDRRASFTVRACKHEGNESQTVGSIPVRCEVSSENRVDGDDKDIDPSKEGVVALLAGVSRFAYRELGAAPMRQRAVYEHLLDVQANICKEL